MSEGHPNPEESPTKKPKLFSHKKIDYIIALVATLIVIFTSISDLIDKMPSVHITTPAAPDMSMFAMSDEIFTRMNSCHYEFLFMCDTGAHALPECTRGTSLAKSVCNLTNNGQNPPAGINLPWPAELVITAIVLLPRLPGAAIYILRERWDKGPLEFWLGVLFVLVYVTMIVIASRMSVPLLMLAYAVVGGPYLTSGLFWLVQYALLWVGATYQAVTAFIFALVGVPGCLLICIHHDVHEAGRLARIIRR